MRAFRALLATDIADLDKSMMCLNLALVHERMGRAEEALAWYGTGVDYERPHHRYHVAEQRAAYLARQGRPRESLIEYQDLLARPALGEADRERIRHNIETLRGRP